MKLYLDLTNINFTEFLIDQAEKSAKGSDFRDAIFGIEREELIKKSDYLFDILESSEEPISFDRIREIVSYENWGAPDYTDEGDPFWE